jgi:hypothetical protein
LTPSYWAQFGEDNSQLTFYPVPGPGSYSFFVTMQSPGCTATKEFEFTETDGYTGYTGYSYSYSQQSSILTVDFEDRQQVATTKLEVSGTKAKTTKISYIVKVFDFNGSLIEQGTSAGETISFNLAGKPNGIYVVNIHDVSSNRLIRSMKFLKEY